MNPSDVIRAAGEALIAARAELNRADPAGRDGRLGDSAASISEALLSVAPEVDALTTAEALRRVGTEIGSRVPSPLGTLLSASLVDASRSVDDHPGESPLAAVAGIVRAVATEITRRSAAERGEGTLLDALIPAADALETAAAADVPPVEGLSLAMLAAYEAVEETGGAAEPLAVAIAFRAAALALA